MKRIILIQPPSSYLLEPIWKVPLTLCVIQTYMEQYGFNLEIVDMAEESIMPPWTIPPDADIYAISVYTPQHAVAHRIASYIRQNNKTALIIAGGHHVSALKSQFLENSDFDAVVVGEGEETFKEICEGRSFEKINGIVYQKDGYCIETPIRERIKDLSSIPFPDFKNINIDRYKGNVIDISAQKYHLGLVTSRGCHFRCAFCASRNFWKQRVTWYSSEKIISYFKYLKEMGVQSLEFLDDNFVVHPDFKKLCNQLKSLQLSWTCMARSDCIKEEKAAMMFESGCSLVSLGIESASNRLLKKMEKTSKVETHIKAIKILKNAGITIKGLMIAGFPGETEEDAQQTEQFIREQPVDLYGFCAFVAFPGTPVWNVPEKYQAVIDRTVPFEEYVLVSKDFGPRPILDNHEQGQLFLNRYIDAAGEKCTNIKAFDRVEQKNSHHE